MVIRGRAASPVRIGFIVKGALQGNIPLRTGETVHEAAIVDLFGAYKREVERVNALRTRDKRIHGMKWASFYTAFRFAKVLGLVEPVREEPMLYPPPGGDLLRIEKKDNVATIVKSTRKIFRLTDVGQVDERCWSDLTTAYKEGWTPGQPIGYVPPTPPTPPKPRAPRVPPAPLVGLEPYVWEDIPSIARFRSLLKHLSDLQSLGVEYPGVSEEIERLAMAIGDWVINTEDNLEEARAVNATASIRRYDIRLKLLNGLSDSLGEANIREAMEILSSLIKKESR